MDRRKWKWLAVLAVLVAASLPLAVNAVSSRFSDVDDGNIFLADIEWMADSEVTRGCGGTEFCPKENVTREQMAAFMRRLSDYLTPEVTTISSSADSKLDLSDTQYVCKTLPWVPEHDFTMIMLANFSARLENSSGVAHLRATGAYRENGGAWLWFTPVFPNEVTVDPDEWFNITYQGHLDLNAGTSYEFSVLVQRPIFGGNLDPRLWECHMTLEYFPK